MLIIPYRLPFSPVRGLFSHLFTTLQEFTMPTRKAHLLTMKLNKDKRMTKQQKLNKRLKNAFQLVSRKPVLQSVNF